MKEDYNWMHNPPEEKKFNPLTHMSDQDRISPYNICINTISSRRDDDKEENQLGDY